MMSIYKALCISLVMVPSMSYSQQSQGGWSTSPFDQKVFIENQGQFKEKQDGGTIMYGFTSEEVKVYFTSSGLVYHYDKITPSKEKGGDEEHQKTEVKPESVYMQWEGANANVKIVTEETQSSYFTYADPSDSKSILTFKAAAYKKIIYKNLYPGIDAEYTLPEKGGVKYALIVHPGADASLVKMEYKNAKGLLINKTGDILISTAFGTITDHAPLSFYKNGATIASSFLLKGNKVSFVFSTSYDKSKTIVIDPWTTNPAYTGFNSAYDVNYDLAGNVYAAGSYSPFKLVKLNSAGAILWTFLAAQINNGYYGDFAVDEITGTSYMIEGLNNGQGSNVLKINTLGIQTGKFNGNTNLTEMWRTEYNRCIGKIVIAGGGAIQLYQAAMLDTNMVNVTPVNVMSATKAFRDMALLAIDNNSSFCYMGTTKSVMQPSIADDNILIKCPIPALIPLSFAVRNYHKIGEMGSVAYVNNMIPNGNAPAVGFNGMAVSPMGVYTYDSDSVKKWNKNTGALIATLDASSAATIYGGFTGGEIRVDWSGLAADECDNLYVAVGNQVKQYNSALTLVNTYNMTNTVYDIKLGLNNKLYACGKAFVQEILVTAVSKTVTATSTATGGCSGGCIGTATANIMCGNTNVSGYGYSWNPGGQTTQTATALCAGNYTVTVSNNCLNTVTASVAVTGSGGNGLTVNSNVVNANCSTLGSATASTSSGSGPYTFSWNTGGQTTQTATGLGAGNYTVTVTDKNGCSGTTSVSITSSGGPTATVSNSVNATCSALGSATASANSGTGPYTYSWNNTQTGQTATGLNAGTYTVTVTDNNGCTVTTTVSISASSMPAITGTTPNNVLCNGGTTGSASATAAGGTGTLTYVWSNGQSAQNATGLSAGTYTIVVTDNSGCTTTTTVNITEPILLTINTTGSANCSGQNASATSTAGGGTGSYTYLWNNGQTASSATNLNTGNYTITVSDANGCTAQATVGVNSQASPSAVFTGIDTVGCAPLCVTFNNTSSNIITYSWSFGDGSSGNGSNPKHCYTSPGTYSVTLTVTDNNGCTGTYAKNNWIEVYPLAKADFIAAPQPTTLLNPTIQFTDKSTNASSWTWSFGDVFKSKSNLQNPSFTYKDSGCYTVQLKVDNQYGCADSTEKTVCIKGDYELFAPNAFTPDGDGLNDTWNVHGIGIDPARFKLYIFDRWGNLIFETNDLYLGWNGHANGGKEIAQQDVYVWKVATHDFDGGKHNYIGHVSLVR